MRIHPLPGIVPARRLGPDSRMRSRSPDFSTIVLALPHRLFQFFLVIGKQSMNLAVRFVADSVNLRTKLLPRRGRILVEQRLNYHGAPQAEAGHAAAVPESTPDVS